MDQKHGTGNYAGDHHGSDLSFPVIFSMPEHVQASDKKVQNRESVCYRYEQRFMYIIPVTVIGEYQSRYRIGEKKQKIDRKQSKIHDISFRFTDFSHIGIGIDIVDESKSRKGCQDRIGDVKEIMYGIGN